MARGSLHVLVAGDELPLSAVGSMLDIQEHRARDDLRPLNPTKMVWIGQWAAWSIDEARRGKVRGAASELGRLVTHLEPRRKDIERLLATRNAHISAFLYYTQTREVDVLVPPDTIKSLGELGIALRFWVTDVLG